jgi:hypothetical protein
MLKNSEEKAHRFLVTAQVWFPDLQNKDEEGMTLTTCIIPQKKQEITLKDLKKIIEYVARKAEHEFNLKEVTQVVLLGISYLGYFTDKEFIEE